MNDPHPSSVDVAYASGAETSRRLEAASETSSRQSSSRCVARIDAIDATGDVALHAWPRWAEDALERRRASAIEQRARGEILGPLHGLPVLIKDNIEARGLPGLAGSTSLRGRPSRDAALVTRLREAGAIVLGSTNLSQWANIRSPYSTSGYSASGGLVGNPWALDRSAGGSSSGSGAALAAGLAPLTRRDRDRRIHHLSRVAQRCRRVSSPRWATCRVTASCRSVTPRTVPGRWRAAWTTWRSLYGAMVGHRAPRRRDRRHWSRPAPGARVTTPPTPSSTR